MWVFVKVLNKDKGHEYGGFKVVKTLNVRFLSVVVSYNVKI